MSSVEESYTYGEGGENGDGIVSIVDVNMPIFVLEILGQDGDDSVPYNASYLNIVFQNKIVRFNQNGTANKTTVEYPIYKCTAADFNGSDTQRFIWTTNYAMRNVLCCRDPKIFF
jgi:hypothetical protein